MKGFGFKLPSSATATKARGVARNSIGLAPSTSSTKGSFPLSSGKKHFASFFSSSSSPAQSPAQAASKAVPSAFLNHKSNYRVATTTMAIPITTTTTTTTTATKITSNIHDKQTLRISAIAEKVRRSASASNEKVFGSSNMALSNSHFSPSQSAAPVAVALQPFFSAMIHKFSSFSKPLTREDLINYAIKQKIMSVLHLSMGLMFFYMMLLDGKQNQKKSYLSFFFVFFFLNETNKI